MKKIFLVVLVLVFAVGLVAITMQTPAYAAPPKRCRIIFDPAPGFTCGPCEELRTCCMTIKRCGCVKIPGCKL